MLLPALARARLKAQGIGCMNNSKQLCLAWRMYAEDNRDTLPFSYASTAAALPACWIPSGANYDLDDSNPKAPQNWNYDLTVRKSLLWPYCGNQVGIWHCPADTALAINNLGQTVPRVRSMSMSNWVGGNGDVPPNQDYRGFWGQGANWVVFRKLSGMVNPGPAMTYVLLDERQDSINDGYLVVEMDGYPNLAQTKIVDYPASYHGGACGFAFADGHSEVHKWKDLRTMPPLTTSLMLNQSTPNNIDVNWMQEHCTRVAR